MKKISFLVAGLFLSHFAMSQVNGHSDVVNITIPKKAAKLTKEKLVTYTNSNYKRSQVPIDKENIYQIDGLIVSFWDVPASESNKRDLPVIQSEILGILKRNNENVINYSKIITVNNIQFLVFEYQKGDEVFLRFISELKNHKNLNGIIQFKKPDEDKAQEALKDLLGGMHFKNE